MRNILIALPLIALSLWACKKEELPPVKTGETVFELEGKKSGQDFHLIAGIDGYYMNSNFSNPVNANEFGTFSGKLMHYQQLENNESIEIIISNSETGPLNLEALEDILSKTELNYSPMNNNRETYEVRFHAEPTTKQVQGYLWDFGDGNSDRTADPIHRYTELDIEIYRVCLEVTYTDNCTDMICSDVFMPLSPCRAEIIVNRIPDSSGMYEFSAKHKGVGPFVYNWRIGNSNLTDSIVSFRYNPAWNDSVNLIKLSIRDANNCLTYVEKNISVFNIPKVCMINFNYEGQLNVSEGILPDAYISVIYKNDQGVVYSSTNGNQTLESFFTILGSENYLQNEKSQATKKVDLNFSCDLYDESGNKIELRDITGKIALSYPD